MEKLAFTLDILGKIMVAYTVLSVHGHVAREQKIDKMVFRAMKQERIIGLVGIILMLLGYITHVLL